MPRDNTDSAPSGIPVTDPGDWVDLYADKLFRIALSKVRDQELAKDLVQETMLAGIKALDSFEGRAEVETWLKTILRNKIIDHFRRGSTKGEISESEIAESVELDFSVFGIWNTYVPNWARDPEKALEDQQFLETVKGCIGKLPDAHRTVFELKFLQELDQGEICKAAGISPSNYWVIIHRARMALRRCVEKNWSRSS